MLLPRWLSLLQIYFLSRINAPAKRFGRTLTNQGQSALIPSSSLKLFFLSLFGRHNKSESTLLAAKTHLSRVLCNGHSSWNPFTEEHAATSFTHRRTSLAVSHTSDVLDMTLNSLMVMFQWCWSFGEYGVPLHCHCSLVHPGPAWLHLIGPYLWVK